jgi:hypothetical protein
MVMSDAEIANGIHGGHEVALETEIVQGFHVDQPLGVLVEQLGKGGALESVAWLGEPDPPGRRPCGFWP